MASILTLIFQAVQDWGLAVLFMTLFVRLLLFPLNLRTARQYVLQSKIQPELKTIRERYTEDRDRLLQETIKLYQKYNVKPMSMFTTALLQMPIFMAMYGLFLSHGSTMYSVLLPWVVTLAQADPWHIVPIFSTLLTFLNAMIPLAGDLTAAAPMGQRLLPMLLIVPVSLFFLWKAPIALGLYWTAGSIFALLERGFYRTRVGKTLLLQGAPAQSQG
jgi:YidC/Oxa1 family membrane protein insertase